TGPMSEPPPTPNIPGLPGDRWRCVANPGRSPLCSSTHAAAWWSSSTFAGQRPDGAGGGGGDDTYAVGRYPCSAFRASRDAMPPGMLLPPVVPILHASTLIAPVPCVRTFLATVFSARGLRARTIGSNAGLSAVPQPSHCAASGVIGSSLATLTGFTPSALAVATQCVRRTPSSIRPAYQ